MATKKSLKARATQGQRKPSYEGGQYRGGRKKKTKNLIKLDNGYVKNEHGVVFSPEDKKRLESLVNRANRKRVKMLKEEASLPRFDHGVYKGETLEAKQQGMNGESDFILTRKSKSLQRFKKRQHFDSYLRNLERINSPDYIEKRVKQYKENYCTALRNVFGDRAKDLIKKIEGIDWKEFQEIVASDESLEIYYIYDDTEQYYKLNQLLSIWNSHLGIDEYEEIE